MVLQKGGVGVGVGVRHAWADLQSRSVWFLHLAAVPNVVLSLRLTLMWPRGNDLSSSAKHETAGKALETAAPGKRSRLLRLPTLGRLRLVRVDPAQAAHAISVRPGRYLHPARWLLGLCGRRLGGLDTHVRLPLDVMNTAKLVRERLDKWR